MALKRIIAKAVYDALNENVRTEYKQVGEEYHLDVEGEDFSHVTQKKNIAEEHRKKAETRVSELEEQLNEMRRGNLPKADVEALENSHREKYSKRDKEAKDREAVLVAEITRSLVDARALSIAKEISTAPDLLAPVIASRFSVVEKDGKFELQVKDKLGVAGVMSADDLVTEIKADKRYESVIVGSKGNGGGAGGAGGGGGGEGGKQKKLSEMNDKERMDWYRRDPEGFRKAAAEQQ